MTSAWPRPPSHASRARFGLQSRFRHAGTEYMVSPAWKRRKTNGGNRGRHRAWGPNYRAPRGRAGTRSRPSGNYGRRFLARASVASRVPRPIVQRRVETDAISNWALVPTVPPAPPANVANPMYVLVPNQCWTSYTMGFDISQVTSRSIHSRNVTCNLSLKMPVAAAAPQPYQIRIVQGYCKMSLVGYDLKSTYGTTVSSDGCVINFDPSVAFPALALSTAQDFIGTQNGQLVNRGNVSRAQIHVLSDRTHNVGAAAVLAASTYFPSLDLNFNWKTNKRMRLFNYSPDEDVGNSTALTPVNNPNLWIPFVAPMILNFNDYQNAVDMPKIQTTWAHYWTNC